jgi:DNA-binding IclR family transcriptional regulator
VARRSPPTARVVAVLEELARHPARSLTVSELARSLDLTRSTCLGILNELVVAGYVTHLADERRYRLGPGLIWLGRSAQAGMGVVDAVFEDLEQFAARHQVAATVSTVVGDSILVLARSGPTSRLDQFVQPGQEYPYAPPSGVVFAVWEDNAGIDRWLASYPQAPVDRAGIDRLASSARRLGCVVERFSEASARSLTVLAKLAEHDDGDELAAAWAEIVSIFPQRYYLLDELATCDVVPVTLCCAPVYGPGATPQLLLGALVFDTVRHDRLAALVDDLVALAGRTTEQLGGRDPWAPHVRLVRPARAGGSPVA